MRGERFDALTRRGAFGLLAGLAVSLVGARAATAKGCLATPIARPAAFASMRRAFPSIRSVAPRASKDRLAATPATSATRAATARQVRPPMRASRTAAAALPTAGRAKPASAASASRSIRCVCRMGRSARRRAIAANAATPAASARCRRLVAASGDIATTLRAANCRAAAGDDTSTEDPAPSRGRGDSGCPAVTMSSGSGGRQERRLAPAPTARKRREIRGS